MIATHQIPPPGGLAMGCGRHQYGDDPDRIEAGALEAVVLAEELRRRVPASDGSFWGGG